MEQEQFVILSKYFIRLVRYGMGLTNTSPEKPDEVSWKDVYEMARNHSLTGLAFEGVKRSGVESEDEFVQKLQKASGVCMHADLQQQIAWEELKTIAAEKGLDLLPLKGVNLKSLYPRSDLRQMGDLDILYRKQQFKELKKALEEAGYSFKRGSVGAHHQVFDRPPNVHLEMHGSLVDEEIEFADYYADPWSKAKKTDEKNIWRFSLEDEYIFLLLHAAKHFFHFGSGIRTFLDLYAYLERYQAELDFSYVEGELAKATALAKKNGADYDLAEFEKTARALAYGWFGSDDVLIDQTALTVLSGGVYGVLERGWKKDYEKVGKNYVWRRLFPPFKKMRERNPVLKKAPFLLPFFWFGRLVKALTSKKARQEYRYVKKQKKSAKDLTKTA